MFRKVICLASFVLVLGLALTRTADADLFATLVSQFIKEF